jgi:protein gp37
MAGTSSIEWTEATWNPVTGCDRVSAGCDHCYALTLAKRLKAMGNPRYQADGRPETSGPGFGVTLHPDALEVPERWRRPRVIFVNSMSDLFHPRVPDSFIGEVFAVMARCPQHTFQVLTKRPKRMAALVGRVQPDPLPNVWLGTSIEAEEVLERADQLRRTPAAIRFLSLEPLLGPLPGLDLEGVHWVITGGESGPRARPIEPEWVTEIRDCCLDAGVAFFHKQWGGRTPKAGGRTVDGRTWDQMPMPSLLMPVSEGF